MENMNFKTADMFIRFPFVGKQHALETQIVFPNQPERIARYLDALLAEMQMAAPDYEDVLFRSVRIGGGSPTLLEPKQLARLITEAGRLFHIAADAHITVETEPNLLTSAWMVQFQKLHIDRVEIRLLTGRHSDYERYHLPGSLGSAQTALMLPQIFSIRHYSAVILYGLPGQREQDLLVSTRFCCKFNTPEIIFERFRPVNHALWRSCCPSDGQMPGDVMNLAKAHLLEKGYTEYKQNHFALPSFTAAGADSTDCVGFGISTLTHIDGVTLRTTGILNQYLDHSDDPEAIYTVSLRDGEAM